jgi:DNA-binding MarR family transcriptional regulator
MSATPETLRTLWDRLANKLVFLEKRYVHIYGDLRLHPSELHVLLAVRAAPDANATQLAATLGVTKGAVSQVQKRLEGKGVIVRRADASRKNAVTSAFTPLGRTALEDFLASRAAAGQAFAAYLEVLPPEARELLAGFLAHLFDLVPEPRS